MYLVALRKTAVNVKLVNQVFLTFPPSQPVSPSEYRGPGFGYNVTINRDNDSALVFYEETTNTVYHTSGKHSQFSNIWNTYLKHLNACGSKRFQVH